MNRYFMKRCHYCFIPALARNFSSNTDKNIFDQPVEYDPQPKTGFERVQAIFQPTKDGIMTKEYYSVVQLSVGTFIAGLLVGGIKGTVEAHENFLIEHRATKFVTAYEAHRLMVDHTILSFVSRGFRFGLKAAAFTFIYAGTVVIIAAYRGYDGFLEYCVSGAIAGGLVRAYLGYKAAFAGALLGSILSTLTGCMFYITTKFGASPAEVRQMQYDFMLRRTQKISEESHKRTQELALQLHDKGLMNADNFGYPPDDKDKVFIIANELPKGKPKGIDALPDLPDEKI